jgi:hypothetical protein
MASSPFPFGAPLAVHAKKNRERHAMKFWSVVPLAVIFARVSMAYAGFDEGVASFNNQDYATARFAGLSIAGARGLLPKALLLKQPNRMQ